MREGEAKGAGKIDDEIELCRLLDRQVTRLGSPQDPIDIAGGSPEIVRYARAVCDQTAVVRKFPLWVERRHAGRRDECENVPAMVRR